MHRPKLAIFSRRHRFAVLALLFYEAFFLNVLVPVHTRGAITLNGTETASCCASHESRHSPKREPTEKDKQNCAICNFAARMSAPPVICHVPPVLGLLHVLPVPPPHVAASTTPSLPYLSRGPPAFA